MTVGVVYICSAGHSGSTLLDLILGSHSRMVSLGEVVFVPSSMVIGKDCSCGAAMSTCEYWQRLLQCMERRYGVDFWQEPRKLNLGFFHGHRNVDFERLTRWYVIRWKAQHAMRAAEIMLGAPVFSTLTREFRRGLSTTFDYYDCARAAAGRPIVVDSSKHYIKGISLYQSRPDEVRLILLSRDGRGVMHSHVKRGVSRDYAISAWRNYYRRALPLIQRAVPESHVLRLQYEDLATNPESVVRNICSFTGIDFESRMLDFGSCEHHITEGNDMRSSDSSEIRLSTAWRHELSAADLEVFERRCGGINRMLGYR
jgi:hypothetical protein